MSLYEHSSAQAIKKKLKTNKRLSSLAQSSRLNSKSKQFFAKLIAISWTDFDEFLLIERYTFGHKYKYQFSIAMEQFAN